MDLGNVPCYIDKTAKLKTAVTDLVLSKSFDNGMICASEQAVIVDKEIAKEFEKLMKEADCYFLNKAETEKLEKGMFKEEKLISEIAGQSPYNIAKNAGVDVPETTKVLVVPQTHVGEGYPFSKEKLSPVLSYYIVKDETEGIDIAERLIEFGGLGHSAVIHSENEDTIRDFSNKVKVRKDNSKFSINTWSNR